ncbi:MAG: drug/metabolite exporter YedA [Cardiobacteriaceae bacterium]|nr:drug/metabolite exporter YedA [Cardiobacteriaceae bacterium]
MSAASWRLFLALLTVYIVWGSTYLGIRFALEGGFPPFWLGAIRFFLAGSLMYAVLRARGYPRPTLPQWRNCALLGFLMLAVGNGMVNTAQQYVSSGITAVAVASSALWIALFATLRGERSSRTEWLGITIGFAGIILLNIDGELSASRIGLVALLIAPLSWAFASIWSRGRNLPAPFMAAAAQMLCASVIMFAIGLGNGERFATLPSASGWLALFYLILFGSVFAYSAYVWLLQNARPALVGSYAYVNPVIAVLLGAALAHERPGGKDLIAIVIILGGVLLITLSKTFRKKT